MSMLSSIIAQSKRRGPPPEPSLADNLVAYYKLDSSFEVAFTGDPVLYVFVPGEIHQWECSANGWYFNYGVDNYWKLYNDGGSVYETATTEFGDFPWEASWADTGVAPLSYAQTNATGNSLLDLNLGFVGRTSGVFEQSIDIHASSAASPEDLTNAAQMSVNFWIKKTGESTINIFGLSIVWNALDEGYRVNDLGVGLFSAGFDMLTATWDGTTAKLYVNGSYQGDMAFGPDLTAGITGGDDNDLLDEVAIFHRALSEFDAIALYNSGSGLPYENIITPP